MFVKKDCTLTRSDSSDSSNVVVANLCDEDVRITWDAASWTVRGRTGSDRTVVLGDGERLSLTAPAPAELLALTVAASDRLTTLDVTVDTVILDGARCP